MMRRQRPWFLLVTAVQLGGLPAVETNTAWKPVAANAPAEVELPGRVVCLAEDQCHEVGTCDPGTVGRWFSAGSEQPEEKPGEK